MTRENVQDLLAMIQGTYPNYNPMDKTATINAWLMALEEYDKNEVAAAFKMYMKSNSSGFAPAPGQLIENIQTLTKPQELNEMEAWSLVSKALKNGYYGAEEEFAKLPPIVQRAVGQPSQLRAWAQTDTESIENVVQSNFIKTYRAELTRAQQISKLPQGMQNVIGKVNDNRGIEIKPYVAIEDKPVAHNGVPMSDEQRQRFEKMKEEWA